MDIYSITRISVKHASIQNTTVHITYIYVQMCFNYIIHTYVVHTSHNCEEFIHNVCTTPEFTVDIFYVRTCKYLKISLLMATCCSLNSSFTCSIKCQSSSFLLDCGRQQL